MLIFSFSCYFIIATVLFAFGLVYLIRREFMPYHSVALSKKWQDLEENLQILILALMRVAGTGFLTAGLSICFFMFTYWQTQKIIFFMPMAIISLITSLGSFYATAMVKNKTSASPPIELTIISIVLSILGAIAFTLDHTTIWVINNYNFR